MAYSNTDFNFLISEIEIKENGNLILGFKGGKVTTNDGFEIIGEEFIYEKSTNILKVLKM